MIARLCVAAIMGVAITGGMLYLMDYSSRKQETITDTPPSKTVELREDTPALEGIRREELQEQKMARLKNAPTATDNAIKKCVVEGNTVYTDHPCDERAKSQRIEIHETAGIVSPSRQTVSRTLAREPNTMKQPPARTTIENKDEEKIACEALALRVKQLDEMARQPHSGQTQDYIRQEKRNVQSAQFAQHC